MDRFDPFVKYADVYGDIINWEKDPMNKPQNQNKYFFSDGKTYYEQICKMLRLMSVFKEAFNQIYSNEDEISEAWENFVNNLSASVVEGSEPDVTLTWTDDSVNFEFTMVPGVPGEQGVGITSISFNSDYTMTITLSDGNTYTSMSLKGETGPQGPQGETGSGLQILDVYATLADLQSAHPTGEPGDAYQVGSAGSYTLYIWSSSQSTWIPAGSLGTVSPSTSNPLMDGTTSAGSLNQYSRGDHVHPTDTSRASKEELDALIKTSQSLIDQSFTYRESPAIQDGLARIDKIKGNTIVWNQLIQNGNFADTSNWMTLGTTYTVANNVATVVPSANGGSRGLIMQNLSIKANHKYLIRFYNKPSKQVSAQAYFYSTTTSAVSSVISTNCPPNTKTLCEGILTSTADFNTFYMLPCQNGAPLTTDTYEMSDVNIFDLTQMGLDITDPSDFTSLFPLSYYDFNQGTLLSFNGNGIKTVGKNQLPKAVKGTYAGNGITCVVDEDGTITFSGTASASGNAVIIPLEEPYKIQENTYLHLRNDVANLNVAPSFENATNPGGGINRPLAPANAIQAIGQKANYEITRIRLYITNGTSTNVSIKPMVTFSETESEYEPYTDSTLSLPISTYFPTGMKSAGTVYDELTPTKAITRIGAVDLGTLDYVYDSTVPRFYTSNLNSVIKKPATSDDMGQILCGSYETLTVNQFFAQARNMTAMLTITGNVSLINTDYTSPTAFKSAMSGVMLYYELDTSTETAIDLDLDFMAYKDGTEQLLPVNGSVPSTSPIIANMTYLSIDDAMEYIIDKLANVPQNTQQILDSLEYDVADLQTDVSALQPAVSALQTSVGNINTNIGQLSSTVAGHTASISDIQSDITDLNTGLDNLEDTVTDNTSRIGTLESGLSATNGNVQNLETSVSDLDDTVTAQGATVTALDSIIQDISNNPVISSLGSHELGFVAAYVSATLAANTGTKVTIPKPTIFPNNYTPLFIVGMSTGSYNVSICDIPYTFGNRDSVNCRVWNHGAQQTTQITVYILCMRQRQSQ